jgi:hypothetical protein
VAVVGEHRVERHLLGVRPARAATAPIEVSSDGS